MFSYDIYILTSKFEDTYCTEPVSWVSQTSFLKQTSLENGLMNKKKYLLHDNLPLLVSVPAHLKCTVVSIMEYADHPLFIAEVKNAVVHQALEPLELRTTGWNYSG